MPNLMGGRGGGKGTLDTIDGSFLRGLVMEGESHTEPELHPCLNAAPD